MKVCVLNGTENVDLTVERENRNTNSRIKKPFNKNGKELKPNCCEIQDKHRNFKNCTEVPESVISRLVEQLVERNIFLSSLTRKHLISQKMTACGRYQC